MVINQFTTNLNTAVAEASSTKMHNYSKYGNIPRDIREQIRAKNRLKTRACRTGDPSIKREANRAAQEIRDALKNLQNERWEHTLSNLNTDDGSLYKMTRALAKGRRKQYPHLVNSNNTKIIDPTDKVELFSLCEQFTENPSLDAERDRRIASTINIIQIHYATLCPAPNRRRQYKKYYQKS